MCDCWPEHTVWGLKHEEDCAVWEDWEQRKIAPVKNDGEYIDE